jgi:NAD(P)-dependent dehydrogenase (short-subunit alcohol dehydrogenase family)
MGTGQPMTVGDRGEDERIAGRAAVVTGAGNGLGRAIALHLHRCGARVILVGRDQTKLGAVAADIDGSRVAVCDIRSAPAVASLADNLAGEDVSILINNAGVAGPVAMATDIDVADWDEVFAANVRSVFLMCKAFLPNMIARRRGDIINIASVTGKRPLVRRTPYAASKTAVIGLSTTLAWEVGPLGVTVNSLSPGPVDGPRMARNFAVESERTGVSVAALEEAFVARAALRRMVTEEEVARAVEAMLNMPGLCAADIDLSAGMVAP